MTTSLPTPGPLSPLGLHRVLDPPGVLPQAAWRLDPSAAIARDEVLVRVDRLNLDAASYRQLRETYAGDPDKIRAAVLEIIATRGKMQNPVTGSGGMLTGTVAEEIVRVSSSSSTRTVTLPRSTAAVSSGTPFTPARAAAAPRIRRRETTCCCGSWGARTPGRSTGSAERIH